MAASLVVGSILVACGFVGPEVALAEEAEAAPAEEVPSPLAGGRTVYFIQAGPSFLTQDPTDDGEASVGPMVRLGALYRVSEQVAVGIAADWETHSVESGGTDLGDLWTVTPTVVAEVGLPGLEPIAPYVSGAVGANVNVFTESDEFDADCRATFGGRCDFDPKETFAARIATGVDFFLSPVVSLNGEIGWKYNSGDVDFEIGGDSAGSGDFDGNSFFILLGTRFSTGGG